MQFSAIDKNNNTNIIIAGIISLVVGVGLARFAFTSLLPVMLDDFLSVEFTGFLASINYVGYMAGTLFAVFISNINTKVKLFRLGLVLSIITSLILSFTTEPIIWIISRLVAGFGTAMALIVGASIVMLKLQFDDKKKAMGWYFSGIGVAIVGMDLLSRLVAHLPWQNIWQVLSIFGLVVAVYPFYILSFDKKIRDNAPHHKFDMSIFSFFVVVLTIAYFTEGVGFVIQATFLPDIINSIDGLQGFGSNVWLMAGFAGIPSSIILMILAKKYGSINIIIMAMLLQVAGILIPTITDNIYLNLLSGILYGGTFVGLVALFMNLAGEIAKHNPVILMATFTTAYGVGQISAPLYSVALFEYSGSYNYGLYLTAMIVFAGVLLLLWSKNRVRINNY
ncbi:MAG: MFS transporter [Gammaproteobacteria bacterium]|nr:MAG: MFS transporter [Gammaproteobacteria bacterium]